jgi:hypothetical protein
MVCTVLLDSPDRWLLKQGAAPSTDGATYMQNLD